MCLKCLEGAVNRGPLTTAERAQLDQYMAEINGELDSYISVLTDSHVPENAATEMLLGMAAMILVSRCHHADGTVNDQAVGRVANLLFPMALVRLARQVRTGAQNTND